MRILFTRGSGGNEDVALTAKCEPLHCVLSPVGIPPGFLDIVIQLSFEDLLSLASRCEDKLKEEVNHFRQLLENHHKAERQLNVLLKDVCDDPPL